VQNSPFTGKEDPNLHLQAFIQLCNTFNMNGMEPNQVEARRFPFSLLGKVLQWFYTLLATTVVTPTFLAPNKSPNKSCAFSKLSSRAQLPPFKP
jgi:hypothetical protein